MTSIERIIDLNFYDLESLNKSILDFEGLLKIEKKKLNPSSLILKITFSENDKNNFFEFFNYLCDLTVVKKLGYE